MSLSKKKILIIIFFIGLIVIINSFPRVESSGEIFYKNDIERDRWAVVVGISNYPGQINDLKYCDDDARNIKDFLMNHNFPENNIKLLIDSQATTNNIENAINWVSLNCDENDYFFFFFSGHGDQTVSDISTIVPYDFNSNGDMTENELSFHFNKINYYRFIALFDSCRSGGLIDSISGENRTIITACDSNEDSVEDLFSLNGGVFTAFFLRAYENLKGDNNNDDKVTLEEAYNYTYNKSKEYAYLHYYHIQNAQMADNISGSFFLGPYFDVLYPLNHYGYNKFEIDLTPIGFGEPLSANLTFFLDGNEYQTIEIQNINQINELSLYLPFGSYEFRVSINNADFSYQGRYYSINVFSFYQSRTGMIILIISLVSSIGISIGSVVVYKRENLVKYKLKESNERGNQN
ncbi:MAG: hypothetical protein GF329_15780 [Candidatus Lokiarchaeota archaeon]|nr:hypothetical protein [Candidatus Lokiarchaeota archaeon]